MSGACGVRAPLACSSGAACADAQAQKRRRIGFWLVAVPVLALLAVPSLAPLFY